MTTTDDAPPPEPTLRERIADLERQARERFRDGLARLCEETGVQPAAALEYDPATGRPVPVLKVIRYPN